MMIQWLKMKLLKKKLFIVCAFIAFLNFGTGLNSDSYSGSSMEQSTGFSESGDYSDNSYDTGIQVTALNDELLGGYEKTDREFIKYEIGNKIVYYHQRKIKGAIVEKDFIVYQFDKDTKGLLKKRVQWRTESVHFAEPRISKREVGLMVEGEILSSKMYIISPESDVFPLTPTPKNPCWVVRSNANGNMIITIIDAMDGTKLGRGIPPPYNGYVLSGPEGKNPCSGGWDNWSQSASHWFNQMGYPTSAVKWPSKSEIKKQIQDSRIVLFYEIAHGTSNKFAGGCNNGILEYSTAKDVERWIASYPKKKFVFLGSCIAMCDVTDDTLSFEFRKGSLMNTVSVGYCGIDSVACETCWATSVDWQERLFNYMCQGYTVKEAFDLSLADYPMCMGGCVRFAGDESLVIQTYVYPPVNFTGEKLENKSLLMREYINILKWEPNHLNYSIDSFKLYEIERGNWNLIEEFESTTSEYWHRGLEENKKYTYALVSVCCNKESYPIYLEVN